MIENRLTELLSQNGDIAAEILQLCDEFHAAEKILLNVQLQEQLRIRLMKHELEEEVWHRLLSIISPDILSENVINYLIQIQNESLLVDLSHMELQNKWLEKLIAYDDAPLYTLARRYYLSDQYSSFDFLQFYHQYLHNRDEISLHLLSIYGNTDKRGFLIYLCSNDDAFEYKESLQWYRTADLVHGLTDEEDLASIYKMYQNVGIVLKEIAANFFTSEEILLDLLSVKGIQYAREIRTISRNTLDVKRRAERRGKT